MQAIAGDCDIDLLLDMRPAYGLQRAAATQVGDELHFGDMVLRASRPLAFTITDGIARARLHLRVGESLDLSFANNTHAWSFADDLSTSRRWWQSGPPIVGRDSVYGAVIERSLQLIHLLTYPRPAPWSRR